jgi:hypothetical protein
MHKLRAFQRTISLVNGDSSGETSFPTINGAIVGYSTKKVGAPPSGESCDVVIKGGGENINDPLDIDVSEITTKNSVKDQVVPMPLLNPAPITAVLTPSATLGSGEDYKVKIIIWYVQGSNLGAAPSVSECY